MPLACGEMEEGGFKKNTGNTAKLSIWVRCDGSSLRRKDVILREPWGKKLLDLEPNTNIQHPYLPVGTKYLIMAWKHLCGIADKTPQHLGVISGIVL